jgi:glycerate kinase
MRKIVIASDSFKGSLTSLEVAEAAAKGIASVLPECVAICMETADGGEGTSEALAKALGARKTGTWVHDPLGRIIKAEYGIAEIKGTKTAVMEMSKASGLPLLAPEERNPLNTSTYGTGEMILDALEKGCRRFLIGIGGSATNDAGAGMLEALGFRFFDTEGRQMAGLCGGNIGRIGRIEAPSIQMEAEFTIACDVDTPFCGPEGAAAVFGPQKGATPESIAFLEDGMLNLRRIIIRECGIDLLEVKGSGAAGGLGGAFKAFLNARLSKGIDMVLDAIGFDQAIQDADLIITGEGKIDSQTSKGKVISGITERARKHGIPVIAIAGICDIDEEQARQLGLTAAFPTGPRPQNESDLKAAMQPETASRNISETIAKALVSLSPSLFHGNP